MRFRPPLQVLAGSRFDQVEPLLDAVEASVDPIHARGLCCQVDMNLRKVDLERADPSDELIELAFHPLLTCAHIAQQGEHEVVGIIGHGGLVT
jgi:hypothetical protein